MCRSEAICERHVFAHVIASWQLKVGKPDQQRGRRTKLWRSETKTSASAADQHSWSQGFDSSRLACRAGTFPNVSAPESPTAASRSSAIGLQALMLCMSKHGVHSASSEPYTPVGRFVSPPGDAAQLSAPPIGLPKLGLSAWSARSPSHRFF